MESAYNGGQGPFLGDEFTSKAREVRSNFFVAYNNSASSHARGAGCSQSYQTPQCLQVI